MIIVKEEGTCIKWNVFSSCSSNSIKALPFRHKCISILFATIIVAWKKIDEQNEEVINLLECLVSKLGI